MPMADVVTCASFDVVEPGKPEDRVGPAGAVQIEIVPVGAIHLVLHRDEVIASQIGRGQAHQHDTPPFSAKRSLVNTSKASSSDMR